MATTFRLKRFTQWDETDNLKKMKDADILAEKKKPITNYTNIATQGAVGAAAGLGAGLGIGAAKGLIKPGLNNAGEQLSRLSAAGKGAAKLGKVGAVLGGLGAAGIAYHQGKKQAKENQFYNDRLAYAQRQAKRRERKDWKTNMTQRDGYSY